MTTNEAKHLDEALEYWKAKDMDRCVFSLIVHLRSSATPSEGTEIWRCSGCHERLDLTHHRWRDNGFGGLGARYQHHHDMGWRDAETARPPNPEPASEEAWPTVEEWEALEETMNETSVVPARRRQADECFRKLNALAALAPERRPK